jgi:hypothetical protein
MPMIDADGCLLNVSVEGRDSGPTLMLSNSLGTTMAMWEPQMKALTQLFSRPDQLAEPHQVNQGRRHCRDRRCGDLGVVDCRFPRA